MRFGLSQSSKHIPLVLSLLVLSMLANAQQYPILELRAEGSKLFSSDDVLKFTGLRVDQQKEIPLTYVREAAEKLVATGVFSEVNYQHTALRNGMKVEFVVKDKDADQFVPGRFENFVWWPEKQLILELHARLPLFTGQLPLGGKLADEVDSTLEALLKARGVKGHVTEQPHNAATGLPDSVDFELEDWPVTISAVTLPGASPAFAADLQNASNRLVGLNYRQSTLLTFADHNLRDLYLKRGYLQAQFLPVQLQVQVIGDRETGTLVGLSIPVTEGVAYTMGSLHWVGNQLLSSEALQKYIRTPIGQAVDGLQFMNSITSLRGDYAMRGYLHMTAEVLPKYDDALRTVNYDVLIHEGDLFSMGKFDVDGLPTSSAEKVRQLWKLREGDPFDATYLRNFFKKFTLPENASFKVEQSEGEARNSIDVTVIICTRTTPCGPSERNALYSPAASPGAVPSPKAATPAAAPANGTQNANPVPK